MDYLCLQVPLVLLDVGWIALLASDMNSQNLEHLTEIAEILAVGLQRLIARQSSDLSVDSRESSLHYDASQSGHAASLSPEVARD
jgi:hypothetical protein